MEEKGVSLRYIQELVGHSDLKTTENYLHSAEKTIWNIGRKNTETREKHEQQQKADQPISSSSECRNQIKH
ncbi:MAG: hypothetical protein LBE14_07890 [Treponema sp.]|nr:hypothetical protein [Treponema sp.]